MYNRDERSKRTRWKLLDIAIFRSPDNLWWLFPFLSFLSLFLTLTAISCYLVQSSMMQVVMEVFFCVAKSKTMRKPSSQHCQQLAYTQKITSKWLFSSFLRHRWRHFVYINILCVLCSWKLCNAFQCHSDYGNGYMIDCYVYVSPLLLLLLLWTSVWPSKFAF